MASIRKFPLVTGEIYHVFNRGIDGRATFTDEKEYKRFVQTLGYYIHSSPPIRLSRFVVLTQPFKEQMLVESWGQNLVTVMDYCLMPNHFHITLRQEVDGGTSRFISQLLNSYTRYFNTKNKRIGQLFLDQFKNVLIENDYQFFHVARYIHLNPYASGLITNKEDISDYKWSSFKEHFSNREDKICDTSMIDTNFRTLDLYKKFVFDNADYQRDLKVMRNLMAE